MPLYIYESISDTIHFSLMLDYSYFTSVCHFLTWNINSVRSCVSSWSGLKTERIGIVGMPLEGLQGKPGHVNQSSWWKSSWIYFSFGSGAKSVWQYGVMILLHISYLEFNIEAWLGITLNQFSPHIFKKHRDDNWIIFTLSNMKKFHVILSYALTGQLIYHLFS